MRRSSLHWLAVFAVLVFGCSDSSAPDPKGKGSAVLAPTGEPDVDRTPFAVSSAAAAGPDLVVLEQSPEPRRLSETALRKEDGSWWQLPSLPFRGFIQLASAGKRAIAGGVACIDDDCEGATEIAFAMLSEDFSEWVRLDGPGVTFPPLAETEMSIIPGGSELALFFVGATAYQVDANGKVENWIPKPIRRPEGLADPNPMERGCIVGDTYVSVITAFPNPENLTILSPSILVGDVFVQPSDGTGQPISAGPVPPNFVFAGGFCGGGYFTILGPETAANFDPEERTWAITPSNLGDFIQLFPTPGMRFGSSAPGRSPVFEFSNESILRRDGTGPWVKTGVFGEVFDTETSVLAVAADRSVTQVWPR